MTQITFEIPQAREFLRALDQNPQTTVRELQRALTKSAFEVERRSKQESPVRTTRLRSSISTDIQPLRAIIAPHVKYAFYVHEGTAAHVILPRRKRALFWKGAAHPVRQVFHPGTKANPFMKRGFRRAEPRIGRFFDAALKNVVDALAD
jgi:hypothetical protein